MTIQLSDEQQQFIQYAKTGKNVLVDACIGSGKTTSIQALCNALPDKTRILYLTYNKLLKLDAQNKIKRPNITVTNYHGFAYMALQHNGLTASVSEMIQTVNQNKPPMPQYDILILDEYQDIELEIAEMLEYIKEKNPNIQIIAVGDMAQKIYDKTTLDVSKFMDDFLGNHLTMEFTQCFRLSKDYAAMLGRIWNKEINGVNPKCEIITMKMYDAIRYLSKQRPENVLCLGSRFGGMSKALNMLESNWSHRFNKKTVYASIGEHRGSVSPNDKSAIFTTFDSSKGLEKDTCVIFDYDYTYWNSRLKKPMQKYEILRNIFLVAASRGKHKIIFVQGYQDMLDEEALSTVPELQINYEDENMMSLFSFKYKENVEATYEQLNVNEIKDDNANHDVIELKNQDGLIDLTPCIGYYMLASYFDDYNLNARIELLYQQARHTHMSESEKKLSIDKKVLLLVALQTNQNRYKEQVDIPYVDRISKKSLAERIATKFKKNQPTQFHSDIQFDRDDGSYAFTTTDYGDIIYDDTLYQLVYTDEVSHEQALSVACMMLGLGLDKSVIWNIRDNRMYKITIDDKLSFLNHVIQTATKGTISQYQAKPIYNVLKSK